ncbi:MAG: hypothetical protein ACRCV9_09790 [Burkholderiaceae bacterium]
MRKRTRRQVITPLPPAGLRRKLTRAQVDDLALVHLSNLDAIAKGQGTEELLWQVVGATLTWSRVAELLHKRSASYEPAITHMHQQIEITRSLVERYGRTGRVGFSGSEYQAARLGVDVMNALAEEVDHHTAALAAEWSERRINNMANAPHTKDAALQALKATA